MERYLNILRDIVDNGFVKQDRTGTGTIAIAGAFFKHDMSEGFPVLTTKRVPFNLVASELEFFIKGITDKTWLHERNNHIWDEWCSPDKVPYSHDIIEQQKMKEESCLGPIYGFSWRNFGGSYKPVPCIHTGLDKTISFTSSDDPKVGKEYTGKYGKYTIIDYHKDDNYNKRYTVKFHKTGYIKDNLYIQGIEAGTVFDPYFPNIQNVACVGEYLKYRNGLTDTQVELLKNSWRSMIHRCYNESAPAYSLYGAKDIYVDDRWLIFEHYLHDVQLLDNWDEKVTNWYNYYLDKDLSGKYFYSRDTCIWVTSTSNNNYTSQNYYFNAVSPSGELFTNIVGLTRFCKEHCLKVKTVQASIKNNNKTHGGWKFYRKENVSTNNYKKGIDQFKNLVDTLKSDPDSRRMLVVAWNPVDNHRMALPPCHWSFQCTVIDGRLNLMWNQRSVDAFLGLPFNITSYALLLHLLAKECNLKEGFLCGFLGDVHVYTTHLAQVTKQLLRAPYPLPSITTDNFTSIFDWVYTDSALLDYKHHPGISAPIAV